MMMSDPLTGGRLTIDLNAISANIRHFQDVVGPHCAAAGVVKADAYGLGLVPVAQTLRACGVKTFFVATPDEGVALRNLFPGAENIAILGGLYPGAAQDYRAHRLTPVLNDLGQVNAWRSFAAGAPCILHIDSGMNRLGLDAADRAAILADPSRLAGLNLHLVMSHFACADDADHPMTARQFSLFDDLARRTCPGVPRSMANSSGAMRLQSYHLDMVRPGMAVYGLNPTPETANPMAPVVRLQVPVLQVRTVPAGDSVGYSATWRADQPTCVATVALGYADGFLRSLSGRGVLYANGVACPVLGRVSMDLVTVDAGGVPGLKPGDVLDVIGPGQGADDLAAQAGTIGYEILTSLGARYRRTYLHSGDQPGMRADTAAGLSAEK